MTRRLSELLASAKLADRDIALAQANAGRDAQNFSSITGALRSLVPAAAEAEQGYEKSVADEAMQGADQLAAENASSVGDAKETPEQMAQRLVRGDKRVQGPQKTGNVVQDFLADPFGAKSRAAAKAQTAAEGKIVAGVHGARDKAAATAIDTATKNAQIESSKASAEAAKTSTANAAAAEARNASKFTTETAQQKAERLVADGLAKGKSLGQISVEAVNAGVDDGDLAAAFAAQKSAASKAALGEESTRADIGLKQSEAAKNLAASKAAGGKPKGPQATSEEAEKIADLKNSLDAISNVRTKIAETPTGLGTAVSAFVGRQPLVGDLADPGAKARGLYDSLEAFKAQELKRLSGSGVTAGERAAFDKFNASIRDNPTTAQAALDEYERAVRASVQNKLSTMHELRGVDVSRVAMPTAAGAEDLSFSAFQKAGG
jgi:hypothetical protein